MFLTVALRNTWVWVLLALASGLAVRAQPAPWQRDAVLSRLLIRQLLTDASGLQWVATDEGVFRYDGYELLPLARLLAPGSAPAPRGQVASLCLDGGGHLWVGADAGLFCLTLGTGAFRRVPLPQEAAGGAAAVAMLFCHPRSGHLWVSYRDVSLVVLDARRGGRVLGPARQLPGVVRNYQPDGTATGGWVSFVFSHHLDPATGREWLSPPGVARLELAGPPQQYLPTRFVLICPCRVQCRCGSSAPAPTTSWGPAGSCANCAAGCRRAATTTSRPASPTPTAWASGCRSTATCACPCAAPAPGRPPPTRCASPTRPTTTATATACTRMPARRSGATPALGGACTAAAPPPPRWYGRYA